MKHRTVAHNNAPPCMQTQRCSNSAISEARPSSAESRKHAPHTSDASLRHTWPDKGKRKGTLVPPRFISHNIPYSKFTVISLKSLGAP